jgi:hypothetical protein
VAETVGTSDRQAIYGSLGVSTLVRGLLLEFTPRYTIVDQDRTLTTRPSHDTIKTLTLRVNATYQLARNISLIGSYTFYQQTTERSRGSDEDIDQNRVFFGVQYAFPITIY